MKKLVTFTCALTLLMTCATADATPPSADSVYCLNLKGEFENAFHGDNTPCLVEVMRDGYKTDTVYLYRTSKKLRYSFERNGDYCLRISKPGYIPMLLCVNTVLDGEYTGVYTFEFSTRLITEKRAKTLNTHALQLPTTMIRFDANRKNFSHDEEYTLALKKDLVLKNNIW